MLDTKFQRDQGLILPIFYEQLLRARIPKAQKDSQVISACWNLKAYVDEIDP